jgi:hypothetical protein
MDLSAFVALTIGTIAIAASNSASRTTLHVRSCIFSFLLFSYATLARHGKTFIGMEDNDLMPTGGTGSNEVSRLVDPSFTFRDNHRLSTMSDLYSWYLFFLTQSSTCQVPEKTEKRRPAKHELNYLNLLNSCDRRPGSHHRLKKEI